MICLVCCTAGASVAIINEESVRDPESWVKLINIRNITFWNTVPAMPGNAAGVS